MATCLQGTVTMLLVLVFAISILSTSDARATAGVEKRAGEDGSEVLNHPLASGQASEEERRKRNAEASCPVGWTSYGHSCLLFKNETYNWFNAKAVCESLGAYLAEVRDSDKNGFLVRIIAHNNAEGDGYTWIGLQDFEKEGMFVWSHSEREDALAYWDLGEPSPRGTEDCVAFHKRKWIDANCQDGRAYFICEKLRANVSSS